MSFTACVMHSYGNAVHLMAIKGGMMGQVLGKFVTSRQLFARE